jgi:hypothetical protein
MESAGAMEKRKCQIMKKDVRVCWEDDVDFFYLTFQFLIAAIT